VNREAYVTLQPYVTNKVKYVKGECKCAEQALRPEVFMFCNELFSKPVF
jgi:hypothetical protein